MTLRPSDADRARGALLGTFVADALGMPFEGCAPETPLQPLEMGEARLGRGTYTDDTQMTIALAESLLAQDGVDEEHLARAFLAHYDPRRGYGSGTREVFARWRQGEPVGSAAAGLFDGRGSHGNGAAMRVSPVAVLFRGDAARLREEAARSARLTHAHPLGVDAAVAQAVAVAAALDGADPLAEARKSAATEQLRARLDRALALRDRNHDPTPGAVADALGNSSAGHESVPAALYAATQGQDFEQAVSLARTYPPLRH